MNLKKKDEKGETENAIHHTDNMEKDKTTKENLPMEGTRLQPQYLMAKSGYKRILNKQMIQKTPH